MQRGCEWWLMFLKFALLWPVQYRQVIAVKWRLIFILWPIRLEFGQYNIIITMTTMMTMAMIMFWWWISFVHTTMHTQQLVDGPYSHYTRCCCINVIKWMYHLFTFGKWLISTRWWCLIQIDSQRSVGLLLNLKCLLRPFRLVICYFVFNNRY